MEFKKTKLNRADVELVKEYCIYFCSTFYLHSRRNRAIETEFWHIFTVQDKSFLF